MGNSGSALGIQLDQTEVYSGGTISGKVFLQVTKETSADTLQIMFEGKEHSHVVYTKDEDKDYQDRTYHAYANRTLVQVLGLQPARSPGPDLPAYARPPPQIDVPLERFPTGSVAPGNYEFPFSVTLPPGLPTSMYASSDDIFGGGDCSISYKLKARLHRPGMMTSDTKATRSINVQSAPLPPSPVPFYGPPEKLPVQMCCCLDRGQIYIATGVDDTLLGRGQSVGVNVAIENESTMSLESVSITITETVEWWVNDGWGDRISNTCERDIAQTMWKMDTLSGLGAVSKEMLKAAKEDATPWSCCTSRRAAARNPGAARTRASRLEALAAALNSGEQREKVTVTPDARDSYMGSCLSTTHRCYVTSALKTLFAIDPELEVPVRIGTPPVAMGTVLAPTAVPPPIVLAQAIPLDEDERDAITTVPANWSGVVLADAFVLPMEQAVVGGTAQSGGEKEAQEGGEKEVEEGTMAGLKVLMDRAFDDFSMLTDLLVRPENAETWKPLLETLSPADFAAVVGAVNIQFDQPKVAELLARQLRGGVTTEHIIKVIKKAAQGQPPTIIKKLAPLCIDMQQNVNAIEAELSEWDRILTKQVLHP